MITAAEFEKWCKVFKIQTGGGGGGGGGTLLPSNILWVSSSATASGTVYNDFLVAYAAAVTAGASETNPYTIVVIGNISFADWAIRPFISVVSEGTATAHLTCTGTISAHSSWGTAPLVLRNFVNLSGFCLTANAVNIAVDPSLNNQIYISNLQYIASGSEEINIQGFDDGFVQNNVFGCNVNYIGSGMESSGNSYAGFVTKTENISGVLVNSIADSFQTIDCRSHEVLGDGFSNGTKFFAPNMSDVSAGAFNYSGANTGITITGDSIVPTVSGPGIGSPAAPTYQTIGQNIDSGHVGVNYASGNGSQADANAGMDAALASAGGMSKVYVTGGYQLVAPNTIYYTASPGKVIFQIPAIFPRGSLFQIVGASASQIGWEVWTHLNQSLIYQSVITDLASNIYATAVSSYYRDCATFQCITANLEIQCTQYDGAALSIYEETSIDIPLTTVTASPSIVYAPGKVISGYSGYLAKLIRTSGGGGVAFASPDFANRISLLSPLDIGGYLADWAVGENVDIQLLDQSGNANDATNSGQCLWLQSDGSMSNISGRSAAQTSPGFNKYMQAALPFFSNPEFTMLLTATRYADSTGSSIATLYAPGNGDDYASALNNVPFSDNTTFTSLRNGNLSVKAIPALNTRMTLTNLFDGVNNTISVNRSNGTVVASTGAFSFNRLLLGGRYVSGGITNVGSYKIGTVILYPTNLSSPEITDLLDYIDLYL